MLGRLRSLAIVIVMTLVVILHELIPGHKPEHFTKKMMGRNPLGIFHTIYKRYKNAGRFQQSGRPFIV